MTTITVYDLRLARYIGWAEMMVKHEENNIEWIKGHIEWAKETGHTHHLAWAEEMLASYEENLAKSQAHLEELIKIEKPLS